MRLCMVVAKSGLVSVRVSESEDGSCYLYFEGSIEGINIAGSLDGWTVRSQITIQLRAYTIYYGVTKLSCKVAVSRDLP